MTEPHPPGQAHDVLAGDRRAEHLLLDGVSCVLGDREVLRDVSLTVAAGERIGLIGENGRGKSTLLRVLAGDLAAQRGAVLRAVTGPVGFLPQQPDFPAAATVDAVLARANSAVTDLAERLRVHEQALAAEPADTERLLVEYGELQDEFVRRGGWEVEARTGEVLDSFGLAGLDRGRRADALSGGERARLALAALVLRRPAAVLLDEPTNHLDDRAVDWLVHWLNDYEGPCLIASHDRLILDTAVTAIIDLDGPRGEVLRYGGHYRDYLAEQVAARRRWEQRYDEWRARLDQARHRVERAGTVGGPGRGPRDGNKLAYNAGGSAAEAAVARATRAAHREVSAALEHQVPRPPQPLRFEPDLGAVGEQVQLRAVGLGGGVVDRADLELGPGTKLTITGPNGCGKSTLLALLAGELAPERGSVTAAAGLRIGHLPQEVDFGAERRPLLDAFTARRALYREDAAAELLRFGLFRRADLAVPVERLSLGQQRRLALALLFARRPQLLLLDEPTNHLSLLLVEQLEQAVEDFPGAVVLVSHDRTLRQRHPERVWHLDSGRLVPADPQRM